MSDDYYNRTGSRAPDNQPVFRNAADQRAEAEVADMMSKAWNCQVHPFGKLCPVDWWIERGGHLAAIAELKTRAHESFKYPTVLLNLRKWSALTLMSVGTGTPAFFVVKFNDGVYWINVAEIDASVVRIGGCSRIVKSHSDIEPVILVPLNKFKQLSEGKAA